MTSPALYRLEILIGYTLCVVVALFAAAVLWKILTGRIDLRLLISEKTGDNQPQASMSRFQLVVFTFVVALSFFLTVAANVNALENCQGNCDPKNFPLLPDIPGGVLALLGISASSYLVSKGIQHSAGEETSEEQGDAEKTK